MKEGDELITLTVAAESAGCSSATLRRMIKLGKLQATKYGKTWLVSRSALDEWVKSGAYNPNMKRR